MSGASAARASIITILDDPAQFSALNGAVTTIGFVAPPGGPGPIDPATYAAAGVTLSSSVSGFPVFSVSSPEFSDGWALLAFGDLQLAFNFETPIHGFAFERVLFGGQDVTASFFANGQLVGTGATVIPVFGQHFVGWYTDFAFDRVVLNQYLVDNISFQTVPASGAWTLLALALSMRSRRRVP